MENIHEFEEAKKSNILFSFVGKLLNLLNYRISKDEAEKTGFEDIIEEFKKGRKDENRESNQRTSFVHEAKIMK